MLKVYSSGVHDILREGGCMRVAVVGSRNLCVDISAYMPEDVTEIVSGGARGIDTVAGRWADQRNIPKVIFKPDYERYGRSAPIKRNKLIVEAVELVIAIWDGKSRGTLCQAAGETGKNLSYRATRAMRKVLQSLRNRALMYPTKKERRGTFYAHAV